MALPQASSKKISGLAPREFILDQPAIPAEYQAFRDLLRKAVKREPKPASAPSPSDKG
jgi:hypothetical protein